MTPVYSMLQSVKMLIIRLTFCFELRVTIDVTHLYDLISLFIIQVSITKDTSCNLRVRDKSKYT